MPMSGESPRASPSRTTPAIHRVPPTKILLLRISNFVGGFLGSNTPGPSSPFTSRLHLRRLSLSSATPDYLFSILSAVCGARTGAGGATG